MRFHNERKHVIDLIFPVALFFVFAASSLVVLLLAANIYSETTAASESGFASRTVLSYVTEKIRQSDENGAVSIGSFDGRDALVIRQTYPEDNGGGNGQSYITYIYEADGVLRELFVQDKVNASASDGKEIMKVQDFTMKARSDDLFEFSCSSQEGETVRTVVSVKSRREAAYE